MTKEQKIEIYSMLLDGATYTECASKFGVSRQYVHQLFPQMRGCSVERRIEKYKYKNLAKWIYGNGYNLSTFSAAINTYAPHFNNMMLGHHDPSKKVIDKILDVTGMTYEEAFSED